MSISIIRPSRTDCIANTQNSANHIHTVWRDFKGDFGRDLLLEHLEHGH